MSTTSKFLVYTLCTQYNRLSVSLSKKVSVDKPYTINLYVHSTEIIAITANDFYPLLGIVAVLVNATDTAIFKNLDIVMVTDADTVTTAIIVNFIATKSAVPKD